MRARFAHLIPILLFALLLAACGDDDSEPDDVAEDDPEEEVEDEEDDEDEEEPAEEEPEDNPFEGETITFIIPYSPGGGYDTYARQFAPLIAEELGADLVFDNQPGGGSLIGMNNLSQAEPDGLTLGIMNGHGLGGNYAAGGDEMHFDLVDDIAFIGRIAVDPDLMITRTDGDFEHFDEVLEAGSFTFGAPGLGSGSFVTASVLQAVFDLEGGIVTGFESSAENELAVLRGEVDGMTGPVSSRMGSIEAGETHPLLVVRDERLDDLPDVPAVGEYEVDEAGQELLAADLALGEILRLIVAPAGIPEDRLSLLRDAMEAVLTDEQVIQEAEEQGLSLAFVHGEEVQQMVADAVAAVPDAYIELLE